MLYQNYDRLFYADFSNENLSDSEKQNTHLLIAEKYANLAWTNGPRYPSESLTV